jgi:hypothetical protein
MRARYAGNVSRSRYLAVPQLVTLTALVAMSAVVAVIPTAGAQPPSPRCDAPLRDVAVARTAASVVAICADPNGGYEYRGVRLSDGATLNLPAEHLDGRDYVARNNGISYQIGTKQLVIIAGDKLIRRENVLEYHEPQSYQAELPPGSG